MTAPAVAINGHAAAEFDGSDDYLYIAAQLVGASYTMAVVACALGAQPDSGMVVANTNLTTGFDFRHKTGRSAGHTDWDEAQDGPMLTSGGIWELWTVTWQGATNTMTFTLNGGSPLTMTHVPTNFSPPSAGAQLVLGNNWNGSTYPNPAHCQIAEVVICNVALGTTDLGSLNGCLSAKYGPF